MPFELEVKNSQLAGDYLIPPFSILDSRQGAWRIRKKAWLRLGVDGAGGRENDTYFVHDTLQHPKYGRYIDSVASVFDPVLCELGYSWFIPEGGHVLDPFAGGCTRGIVAEVMGHLYTGVELRERQVEENRKVQRNLGLAGKAVWFNGSAEDVGAIVDVKEYDGLFTCPPYYNLEVYRGGENDLSEKVSYGDFMAWYTKVFMVACRMLKENTFAVVVVGEVRDKERGQFLNFVGDTITMFMDLGLHYYNEFIYITPVGTLGIRTRRQFPCSRKAGKTHQTVLCFWKGEPKHVRKYVDRFRKSPFILPVSLMAQ